MGLLARLFRRGDTTLAETPVQCPHTALTPRWERPEDMGKEDLASSFRCDTCGAVLSGEEGRRLLHGRRSTAR
jgi:hypothetical protein